MASIVVVLEIIDGHFEAPVMLAINSTGLVKCVGIEIGEIGCGALRRPPLADRVVLQENHARKTPCYITDCNGLVEIVEDARRRPSISHVTTEKPTAHRAIEDFLLAEHLVCHVAKP